MPGRIHWVEKIGKGMLGILPHPRGGPWLRYDIADWRAQKADAIVSLLTPSEMAELELEQEAAVCAEYGIQYQSFPIPDHSVPPLDRATLSFLRTLFQTLTDGHCVLIHCRFAIGRSALVAASLLVLGGMAPDRAFERIGVARGCPVPDTAEQREWVQHFAEEIARGAV